MYRNMSIILALCAAIAFTGDVRGQMEVGWVGGDGEWTDENWDDGTGVDFIDVFVGQQDGSNGSGGPNGEDIITIGSGTVEYPADALGSDFRMKQGSQLIINGGATWLMAQDDTWAENRWTEMDLSRLVLDNGTFSRVGAVGAEGGGALIFGSWRGDDNQDTWLPNQETSIEISNGGHLENEGSMWLSSPDGVLPDSVFSVLINGGTIDLTGGDIPAAADETADETGDLMIFTSEVNATTFAVNFTGPGSITVDAAGINVFDIDLAEGVQSSYQDLWELGILQANSQSGPDGANFASFFNVTGQPGQDDYMLAWNVGQDPQLQAGDADQDLDFDQFDLIMVQQAAKYLTEQPATWGDGDWNGAPGGSQGSPPAGDSLFNQLDIIAALNNGLYLTGPYAAINPGGKEGDGQTSIVYHADSGVVEVDAPDGTNLTSINIDSASGIFANHESAAHLDGSFDTHSEDNIFKATFGSSFGSLSFGAIATAGLSADALAADLTVIGSLDGGGGLGDVDLIHIPEPTSLLLLSLGLIGALSTRTRRRS